MALRKGSNEYFIASGSAVIPQDKIADLLAVIERMENATPLTPTAIFYKDRDRRPDFLREAKEQVTSKIERTRPRAKFEPRDRNHPIHGDTHYALAYQVRLLDAHFEDWLAWAHLIPPSPARRIAAILKRAGLVALQSRFIAAYEAHIPNPTVHVDEIPPPDDADELLAWALQQNVPRLSVTITTIADTDHSGQFNVNFEFCCRECGGYILHHPDDDDERGPAVCKACGLVFGSYGAVRALCEQIAQIAVRTGAK